MFQLSFVNAKHDCAWAGAFETLSRSPVIIIHQVRQRRRTDEPRTNKTLAGGLRDKTAYIEMDLLS